MERRLLKPLLTQQGNLFSGVEQAVNMKNFNGSVEFTYS